MDRNDLNKRCVALFQHPRVSNHMWNARMFWDFGRKLNPAAEELTNPKVDLCELEVLLSAAVFEASQCADELNSRNPGRADFIRRAVQSGQRPVLHNANA